MSCVALTSLAFIVFNASVVDRDLSPVILYTTAIKEPFQQISNLDRREFTSLTQFLKDTGVAPDEAKALVVLCGDDGEKCPQVSNTDQDEFEFTPMNEEQKRIWTKWLALKDQVADLEGILFMILKNMMKKSTSSQQVLRNSVFLPMILIFVGEKLSRRVPRAVYGGV